MSSAISVDVHSNRLSLFKIDIFDHVPQCYLHIPFLCHLLHHSKVGFTPISNLNHGALWELPLFNIFLCNWFNLITTKQTVHLWLRLTVCLFNPTKTCSIQPPYHHWSPNPSCGDEILWRAVRCCSYISIM